MKSAPEQWAEHLIEPATLEAFFKDCAAALKKDRSPDAARAMADAVTGDVDNLWNALEPDQPAYACRKGCSWCCHQNVTVTVPELLQVLAFLRETLDEAAFDKLSDRLNERSAAIAGHTSNDRLDGKIACGFLQDDICSIHAARPLQCRGGFSEDAGYCKDLLEDRAGTQTMVHDGKRQGKFLLGPKMIYNSAQSAMAYALVEADENGNAYELTMAMAVLMRELGYSGGAGLEDRQLAAAALEKSGDDFVTPAQPAA